MSLVAFNIELIRKFHSCDTTINFFIVWQADRKLSAISNSVSALAVRNECISSLRKFKVKIASLSQFIHYSLLGLTALVSCIHIRLTLHSHCPHFICWTKTDLNVLPLPTRTCLFSPSNASLLDVLLSVLLENRVFNRGVYFLCTIYWDPPYVQEHVIRYNQHFTTCTPSRFLVIRINSF